MAKMNKDFILRFVRFGIVGGSGIIVNSAVLWLLHEQMGFSVPLASPLAIGLAVFNNFILNNYWTWRQRRKTYKHSFWYRLMRYYISTSGGALINYIVLILLMDYFGIYYFWANIDGIIVGSLLNFILAEFWVFADKPTHKV